MSGARIREAVWEALFSATARKAPDISAVSRETPLGNGGLGISSLTLLHAFVSLEQQFGVVFDDSAVGSATFQTLGDLEDFVVSFLAREGAAYAVRP